MKKYWVLCGLALVFLSGQAQEKWTLERCISYAVENNIEIKQQELQVQASEINLNTSKNNRLPNLSAGANQNFSFGRTVITKTNTAESGNVGSTSFSLSSSVPLFTGFRIPNEIKQNEFNLLAATEGLNKAKDNLSLQVASLFLDILFKKELLAVYEEQTMLTLKQAEQTQILFNSGKVPESQIYDIRAQLAKDELNITTARNNLDMSLLNLAQALNLPDGNEGFDIEIPDLADAFEQSSVSLVSPKIILDRALGIRSEVKEAEYNIESRKRAVKIAESGHWPSLNLNFGYGTGFDRVFGNNVRNDNIHNQLIGNQNKTIGLSLNVPIFSRFQIRNQVRSAHVGLQNQRLVLENVKQALNKEIQQAYQSAVAAQAKYTSTEKACDASEIAYKFMQEKYANDKATVYELTEAQTKLLTSKSEQVQSKFDFIFRAKILDFYRGVPIELK